MRFKLRGNDKKSVGSRARIAQELGKLELAQLIEKEIDFLPSFIKGLTEGRPAYDLCDMAQLDMEVVTYEGLLRYLDWRLEYHEAFE